MVALIINPIYTLYNYIKVYPLLKGSNTGGQTAFNLAATSSNVVTWHGFVGNDKMMMGSGGDGKPMANHHVYLEISWKLNMETTFCRKYHGNHK